jgi:photosystem II stability/assembly factor-like uncharacterized protein
MLETGVHWDWVGERLVRTTDGGKTWQDVTPSGYGQTTPDKVVSGRRDEYFFDAQSALFYEDSYAKNAAGLFAKDTSGLWRTTDGGKTWAFSTPDDHLDEFHFTDASHGWARSQEDSAGSADIQYFQTEDGGVTWEPIIIIPPGAEAGWNLPPGDIRLSNIAGDEIAYYPPMKAIITTDNNLDYERPKGAVHLELTTNLGKTWRSLELPLPAGPYHDGYFHARPPVFLDARQGLLPVSVFEYQRDKAGNLSGRNDRVLIFYTTQDGGETWTAGSELAQSTLNPSGNSSFSDVFASSAKDILVREGAIFDSTHDGGKNWQTIQPQLNPAPTGIDPDRWEINFLDAAHGTLRTYDDEGKHSNYETFDGGVTWAKLPLL